MKRKYKIIIPVIILLLINSTIVLGKKDNENRKGSGGAKAKGWGRIKSSPPDDPTSPPSDDTEPNLEFNIFSDPECTIIINSIDWGEINVGGTSTAIVYVKNTGDIAQTLTLQAINWDPVEAENFMTVDWDYDGAVIAPLEIRQLTLSLVVGIDCPPFDYFGFAVVITGS